MEKKWKVVIEVNSIGTMTRLGKTTLAKLGIVKVVTTWKACQVGFTLEIFSKLQKAYMQAVYSMEVYSMLLQV